MQKLPVLTPRVLGHKCNIFKAIERKNFTHDLHTIGAIFNYWTASYSNRKPLLIIYELFFVYAFSYWTSIFVVLFGYEGRRISCSLRWQSVVEMTYQFVGSLVEEQIGAEGRKYFPLILTTFLFLLSNNLIGMIPYSFTATSHLVVTFGLSLSLFIGITTVGFNRHGIHFFSFLIQKALPWL